MKIIVDAMGGDNAPQAPVRGAVEAVREYGIQVTLVGRGDEILAQLKAVQEGQLEDWELEGAKSTLLNAYTSMGDSQSRLENFYLGQTATGQSDTPEELAEEVRRTTPERIFRAMETVRLDTVYFLKGKEAAE